MSTIIDSAIAMVGLGLVILGPLLSKEMVFFSFLFVLKWIMGRSSCVFGLAECKIRGCERRSGYINKFIDGTYDLGVENPPMIALAFIVPMLVVVRAKKN